MLSNDPQNHSKLMAPLCILEFGAIYLLDFRQIFDDFLVNLINRLPKIGGYQFGSYVFFFNSVYVRTYNYAYALAQTRIKKKINASYS